MRQRQGLWGRRVAAVMVGAALLALATAAAFGGVRAATGFANPAFQTQWAAGETVAPNFWGPLALARNGQQEQYAEAPGGQRLVQYFDKARMELTNPATNTVTNGLLAVEMISGRVQIGDSAFETHAPAAVPMAGDPNNVGPTYAMLKALEAQILVAVSPEQGAATTRALTPVGTATAFPMGATYPQANVAAYDKTTGHNVPAAFASFRDTAGLASIGLAISEPFWSNVTVAGQPKDVLIQAFERRVLTYTPTNPARFQVEFGNIGVQYYTWRYGSGGAPAPPPASGTVAPPPAPSATATTPAATTTGASGRPACIVAASAVFVDNTPAIRRGVPVTITAKVLDVDGNVCGDGTQVVIADTGVISTFAGGSKAPNGAAYVVVPVVNGVATATITISAGPPSTTGPVNLGVYRLRPPAELANGGFGTPFPPEYRPALL